MDLFTQARTKEIIFGTVPSKSNQYRIIEFKSKETGKEHLSLAKGSALKKYEKMFFQQCVRYRNQNIDSPFTLDIDVYYPNRRSDLDGCFKVVFDCLQKIGAIKNDNLCTKIVANKFIDKQNPRIEFIITTI